MSNPCLTVEKVTESQLGIVIKRVSFSLAANDTDSEGEAFT